MKKKNPSAKLRYAIALAIGMGVNKLALAVGLGPIQVSSYLGQPLSATIRIDGLTAQTAERTVVRLAGAEAYRARGVELLESHKRLAFAVQPVGDGYVINVSSQGGIQDSFLNFLVTLNGEGGVITREYSVFLEPNPNGGVGSVVANAKPAPVAKAEAPKATVNVAPASAPAVAQVQAVPVPVRSRPQAVTPVATPAPVVNHQPRQPVAAPANVNYPPPANPAALAQARTPAERAAALVSNPVNGVYGPVKPGETLYSIANALRPHDVTVQQMVRAIYEHNRGAFANRNTNSLMVGAMLQIPHVSPSGAVGRPASARQYSSAAPVTSGESEEKSHPARKKSSKKTHVSAEPSATVERAPVANPERGTVTVYRGNQNHGAVVQVLLPDGQPADSANMMKADGAMHHDAMTSVETTTMPMAESEQQTTTAMSGAEQVAETATPTVENASAEMETVAQDSAQEHHDATAASNVDIGSESASLQGQNTESALQLDSVSSIDQNATLPEAEKVEETQMEAQVVEPPAPVDVKEEAVVAPVVAETPKVVEAEPVSTPEASKPMETAPVEVKPAPKPVAPAPEPVLEEEGLPLPLIAGAAGGGLLLLGGLGWFFLRRRAKPYEGEDILEDLSLEELEEMERSMGHFDDEEMQEEQSAYRTEPSDDLDDLSFDRLQTEAEAMEEAGDLDLSYDGLMSSAGAHETDDALLNQMLAEQLRDTHVDTQVVPKHDEFFDFDDDFVETEGVREEEFFDIEMDNDSVAHDALVSDVNTVFVDPFPESAPSDSAFDDFGDLTLPELGHEPLAWGDLEEPAVDTQVAEPALDLFATPAVEPVAIQEPMFDAPELEVDLEHDLEHDFTTMALDHERFVEQPLESVVVDEVVTLRDEPLADLALFDDADSVGTSAVQSSDLNVSVEKLENISVADNTPETPAPVASAPVATPASAPVAMEQDMSINLELAHSFIATGRPERARTWLEEVLVLGTAEQKAEAERLLQQIGA